MTIEEQDAARDARIRAVIGREEAAAEAERQAALLKPCVVCGIRYCDLCRRFLGDARMHDLREAAAA